MNHLLVTLFFFSIPPPTADRLSHQPPSLLAISDEKIRCKVCKTMTMTMAEATPTVLEPKNKHQMMS
jgi:hypothetical protein